MPARTQLFDSKAKPVHSFGSQHRNVLLYQPQGKLLLSAGFGNLAGGVDVWDVSTRQKVAEFKWVCLENHFPVVRCPSSVVTRLELTSMSQGIQLVFLRMVALWSIHPDRDVVPAPPS
jgi:hypothetical protein